MNQLQEIQAQLHDTKAAIARLEQAVTDRPDSTSLRVTLQSLQKRRRDLERQLRKYQGATKA